MRTVFLSACVVLLVVIAPEAWSAVINKDVCRKGAVYLGGQCLSFSTDALSWHEAVKACSSLHGQLVTLNDPYAVFGYVFLHKDCHAPWQKIPGSDRCYLFSREVGEEDRAQPQAVEYCEQAGGYLTTLDDGPAREDPLITYITGKGWLRTWVGATKGMSGKWMWEDGSELSLGSSLWDRHSPSGDGDCTEIYLGALNDLSCIDHTREYVCEKNGGGFWTGGSDIATEGKWVWLTGEPFVHFPWSPPEPNNANNEDCLMIQNNGFNDKQCNVASKYICEYEVPGQAWRNDLRCGENYLAPNGKPAECDPSGKHHCCSGAGWCGNSGAHCECEDCVDYRVAESDDSSEELECPEGFFLAPGSYQCFKFFGEKRLNWFEANIKCGENGLRLAKPFNALALRAYLVERYGPDARVHVGARGIGSKMVWEHDGRELGVDNTLWRNGQPGNKVTSDYCVRISARETEMKKEPKNIYYSQLCTYDKIYALCEFVE